MFELIKECMWNCLDIYRKLYICDNIEIERTSFGLAIKIIFNEKDIFDLYLPYNNLYSFKNPHYIKNITYFAYDKANCI